MKEVLIMTVALCFKAFAEDINLTGKIMNAVNGSPLQGVAVSLGSDPTLNYTTKEDGSYVLVGTMAGSNQLHLSGMSGPAIRLKNGVLEIAIAKKGPVAVETFLLNGALSSRLECRTVEPGLCKVDMRKFCANANLFIVKVTQGSTATVYSLLPAKMSQVTVSGSRPQGLAKSEKTTSCDTLIFTKRGFATAREAVINPIGENAVFLIPLPQSDTSGCPVFMHENDAPVGDNSSLAIGYYVFDRAGEHPGLFGSRFSSFRPFLVPNTNEDLPEGIAISDNGKWIIYFDDFHDQVILIRPDGSGKTVVPANIRSLNFKNNDQSLVGFLRKSPFGTELYYLASASELRAIQVNLDVFPVNFGPDRCIARLDAFQFHPSPVFDLCVVGDQIFGQIIPQEIGTYLDYTGFITIPNNGTGTASDADVFKYGVPFSSSPAGCAHTMSQDGQYAVANASQFGTSSCVPKQHNGFYMVPFFHVYDPPVNPYNEMIEKDGISINWCPLNYRNGGCTLIDWMGWYFTNDNRYIIGRLGGTKVVNGIWLNEWKSNTWYALTPGDESIVSCQPAAYFGNVDSILGNVEETGSVKLQDTGYTNVDPADPVYKVLEPDGGELFTVGDTMRIKVSSLKSGYAILFLSIQANKCNFELPDPPRAIDPQVDSVFSFVVPDSVTIGDCAVSTASTQCKIVIRDYSMPFSGASDNYFSIRSGELRSAGRKTLPVAVKRM